MLEIRDVRKTFHPGTPNEVRALQGVDLTLDEGSFVIVIGTNGSGKSTLLNAVAGSFFVDSRAASASPATTSRSWPEHRRAELIGRVFQNPFSGTAPTCRSRRTSRWPRGAASRAAWAGRCARNLRGADARWCRQLEHGAGRPAGQCHRQPLRRPAAGADPADGDVAQARTCCCSTSTRRRSTPKAPTR